MKTFLKYSGIIAAIFAIVAFIMILACSAVQYELIGTHYISGTTVIFGGDSIKLAPAALIAFILLIVALIIIIAGIVLPLAKVTALDKVSGILNLLAVIALIFAGILIFCTKNSLCDANNASKDYYQLTVGYVFAGIFALVAGILAVLPAVVNLISKK
ncbi:MAG: hypothetical protein IKN46_04970 [Acholeplasmatales bacterium]|nr:hypothetical protein [Acholeplasmatales bacterium]